MLDRITLALGDVAFLKVRRSFREGYNFWWAPAGGCVQTVGRQNPGPSANEKRHLDQVTRFCYDRPMVPVGGYSHLVRRSPSG